MDYKDYSAARDFIEGKSLHLMQHETKGYAKIGFPAANYKLYAIQGRVFYAVRTNTFIAILEDVLLEATTKYPQKFGTGNAIDVLEAIHLIEPIFEFEHFKEFLRTEQFCYIIENVKGVISNDILRIDLFRQLDPKGNNWEFTGGIFHAFKHFSYKGVNLAIGKDIHDLHRPEQIIEIAIKAFFFEERHLINAKTFYSLVELDENYNLKFVFYYELKTKVYFINTIHKQPK